MTKWVGVLGGGAAAAVVGTGLYLSGVFTPTQTPREPQQAVALPDSNVTEQAEGSTDPTSPLVAKEGGAADIAASEEADPAPIAPPTFDIVRIEPDGSALIAGQGVAGSAIRVLLDGEDISEAQADREGKFVSLLAIAPSDQPRLMSLIMSVDGAEYPSDTEIIVAPFGPAPKLAEAATDADPAPAKEEEIASVSEPMETATAPADDTPATQPPVEGDAQEAEEPERAEAADPAEPVDADPATEEIAAQEPASDTQPETAPTEAEAPEAGGEDSVAETPEPLETAETPEVEEPSKADPVVEQPVKVAEKTDTDTATGEEAAETGQSDSADAPEPAEEAREAPPTLLASDEEGVRVLPGPEVLDSVAIDTISYDEAGDVALAGRGATSEEGGFVRIYLDNTPVTSSRIREDGSWRVNLPEVDNGVYTLRVDEVDEDGTVKSRTETPFQREDRKTLERVAGDEDGAPLRVLTVQPGNTLWQIARDRYGEGLLYVRVFEANKGQIRDPDLIYPGQVFDLPDTAE
ncbi:LysM peptidoglycan-binding domain-containing protein [Primorskyibacter aestuariivivens]|uniref:LysM peptidoglycan-binding domain-containing protein n=1 Tax=Primorskyibacter aestuariivivens TaxID=1888912 RepID=UPI002301BAB9|nr:LysM peptidoglycan-binding domain-containing protein [Primorskyibacter aestuariivivens]MDA7430600.1 LysM peptidoglycan-binding domain-containing protein [Primorskyibacter aestuariivivens]